MEIENRLLNYKNLKIIQNTDWFAFSLDSVLLANFASINKSTKMIMDFCSGNAPIPLILSTKTSSHIIGVELQKEIYELAQKSIQINKLDKQIEILNMNIKDLPKIYETDTFDVITCNPPYFKVKETSNLNKNDIKTIARHELEVNLDDIFSISRKLLKNNGSIAIVHRPERLVEIIEIMKKNNIEPKKLRLVYPKYNTDANTILIEGTKNGSPGMKILSPLYVHDENGKYLEEIEEMFQ